MEEEEIEDSSNMLSIGLKNLNKLFLKPLGLMLCKTMGYFGDWLIADIETGICASWQDTNTKSIGGKSSPCWSTRFHDCNNTIQHVIKQLVSSVEAFRVVRCVVTPDGYKHIKLVELKNPLFKAKNIEEAMVRLDLMV